MEVSTRYVEPAVGRGDSDRPISVAIRWLPWGVGSGFEASGGGCHCDGWVVVAVSTRMFG